MVARWPIDNLKRETDEGEHAVDEATRALVNSSGFVASFDSGTCPVCHQEVVAGERIELYSGGRYTRYAHVLCTLLPGPKGHCYICGGQWLECDCP